MLLNFFWNLIKIWIRSKTNQTFQFYFKKYLTTYHNQNLNVLKFLKHRIFNGILRHNVFKIFYQVEMFRSI